MATSRSEAETDGRSLVDRLTVPASAPPEQAAAIAAAIGAHVRDQRVAAAAASAGGTDTWDGNRWQFAGRLAGLGTAADRVPRSAPRDEWTASGRTGRF